MGVSHIIWWSMLLLVWSLRSQCLDGVVEALQLRKGLKENPSKVLNQLCNGELQEKNSLCSVSLAWFETGAYREPCSGFHTVFSASQSPIPVPRRYYRVQITCSLHTKNGFAAVNQIPSFSILEFEVLR